jgi:hypothetical protein
MSMNQYKLFYQAMSLLMLTIVSNNTTVQCNNVNFDTMVNTVTVSLFDTMVNTVTVTLFNTMVNTCYSDII